MSWYEERFWSRVDKSSEPDGCWLWTGCRYPSGYGQIRLQDGTRDGTHRVSFRLSEREPGRFFVHHRCGNPPCVNPAHLELMTPQEHTRLHVQKWTRENVISAFQECASVIERVPACTDWNPSLARLLGHPEKAEIFYQHRWPRTVTVVRLFGSWNQLVRAAGFTPRGIGQYDRSRT